MSTKTSLLLLVLLLALFSCSASESLKHQTGYSDSPYSEIFEDSRTNYDWRDYYWVSTDDSTCFSEIGYDYEAERLAVTFRDSGKTYIYHDVPESVWDELYSANSRGGFYNSDIKGQYRSERIDND